VTDTEKKPDHYCQCHVCGVEGDLLEIEVRAAQFGEPRWTVHRIERKGGIIQVLTCDDCASLTQDLILQSYMERIRHGLVPGYH